MDDILVGGLALLLGAGFCVRGYLAMRVVIPMWGALMGFLLGYALGATIAAAIGITWSWVILLSGLAVGFLLAVVALVADLPMTILTVLTAFAGGSTIVGGLMLLVGAVNLSDAQPSSVATELSDSPWWFAAHLGLAVAGIVVQLRDTDRRRAGLQAAWAADGGRRMRSA